MVNRSPSPQETSNVPKGFSLIEGRGNQDVLVPTYLVPSTKLALEIEDEKGRLYVDGGEAGSKPRPTEELAYQAIAEGLVKVPADPDFCQREMLNLHAEVKALQNMYGLSYKDAAHRLYMTEVEKLKIEKRNEFGYTKIRETIDNTIINEIYPPITMIDRKNI